MRDHQPTAAILANDVRNGQRHDVVDGCAGHVAVSFAEMAAAASRVLANTPSDFSS
jgi:hypothetical protein